MKNRMVRHRNQLHRLKRSPPKRNPYVEKEEATNAGTETLLHDSSEDDGNKADDEASDFTTFPSSSEDEGNKADDEASDP